MNEPNVPDHFAVVGDADTSRDNVAELTDAIMHLLKDHLNGADMYMAARVYEVLNALAINTAVIIAGSGDYQTLGELFRTSLNENLEIYYQANPLPEDEHLQFEEDER